MDFGVIQGHLMEGSSRTKYFDETEFHNVSDSLSGLVNDGIVGRCDKVNAEVRIIANCVVDHDVKG